VSVVILGQNRFIDCGVIIGYGGRPLLRVVFDPLGIDLATPHGKRSVEIRVDRTGRIEPEDPGTRVVRGENVFTIFWKGHAVLAATQLDLETAHVRLDLRPLGIKIYDDFQGLHSGTNTFAENEIRGAATAIALGD
jgi:hypothetical protein